MRKLRRLFLALALGVLLVAPTGGQMAEEAATFPGQEPPLRGRVKSLRIERATFSLRLSQWVEGQRVLTCGVRYTPQGDVTEYTPTGSWAWRLVSHYDSKGRRTEDVVSHADGSWQKRIGRMVLSFQADGMLRDRRCIATMLRGVLWNWSSSPMTAPP